MCFFAFISCLLQVKLEPRSPAKPSRVVHIRNIPNDVTEAEIVHLGIPFGRVTNVLVLKGKNQVRFSLLFDSLSSKEAIFFLEVVCGLARPSGASSMWSGWSSVFGFTNLLIISGVLGNGGRRRCYFDGQLLQQRHVGSAAWP